MNLRRRVSSDVCWFSKTGRSIVDAIWSSDRTVEDSLVPFHALLMLMASCWPDQALLSPSIGFAVLAAAFVFLFDMATPLPPDVRAYSVERGVDFSC